VANFGSAVYISGGLSPAGVSTDTIFRIDPSGATTTAGTLPGALHDAASAALGGRLLVFGGGPSEGSNRIIQVLPGAPKQLGTLPQALSDLVAVAVGNSAYVIGGWNGTQTNSDIYAVDQGGTARKIGSIPLGVRYPAAASLGGKLIVAGGETSASVPTDKVWSVDPGSGQAQPLPALPTATDHASAAILGGRFYLIGGLRGGVFTDAIISWAPGESHWRPSGHLPQAVSDLGAVPFDGGIAAIGGRGGGGQVPNVLLMKAG
jgi:N-acetylneuraminic acid mutarotase